MDLPLPTAGWEQVGERLYRKIQLYTQVFDQDLDLDNYIVAGAPYGGALALCRDDEKLVRYRPHQAAKPSIDIFSSAGKAIRRIPWENGTVKGLGWSEDEKLLIVMRNGSVRCYYDLQGDFHQFSLGHDAEEHGVKSCRFYDHGMVALLGNNALVSVASYDEPRPKLLATPPRGEVHAWTLMSPAHTLSRSVEVLLSIGETIYTVDATEDEDQAVDFGPFSHLAVSPNGRFAALYSSAAGRLHVIASDFSARLSEHDARSRIPPKTVAWCGNDAVCVAWEDEVHVVGPGGAVARWFYDGRVHVVPDLDGVRVVGNDAVDFVQRVPDATEEVFRPGPGALVSPAAVLLDAAEQLALQSPRADDNIQLIRGQLAEAVDTCVAAAGHEFHTGWQKQLLRAASFGKSVLDLYNSDEFVDMCETLRVLNAARHFDIGLPLSYEQYQRLTYVGLLTRLLNRHEYLLALRTAEYLRLPTDRIYVHWAQAKVRAGSEDDATTCRLIVGKLVGRPGVSFEAIARTAYDDGRHRLATELLNHEPRAGRQVPLLLSMQQEDELALDKAIESGDTDLVHLVLHELKRKLPLSSFFRVVSARPMATALVEASAHDDPTLLKDLYYQDDRRIDGASVFVREALRQPESRTATDKLALAARLLADSPRESQFELVALREATQLMRAQEALDRELATRASAQPSGTEGANPDGFVGLSVHQTLFKLVRLGYYGRVKKVQTDFKVPEKVTWWIRLQALVVKRDWSEIEDIAKARKSPIGWEPFFNQILQAGNPRLAATFIPKCAPSLESGATIGMYEKCGMRVKAAEEAVRLKDADAWRRLLEAAGGKNATEERLIEDMGKLAFMGGKR